MAFPSGQSRISVDETALRCFPSGQKGLSPDGKPLRPVVKKELFGKSKNSTYLRQWIFIARGSKLQADKITGFELYVLPCFFSLTDEVVLIKPLSASNLA